MLRVPTVVVIGGGAIGAGYVRQLLRAAAAGRLETDRIRVVDRDPNCPAARAADPRVDVEVADWSDWLDAEIDRLGPQDHLVPHHWAPHLLLTWLERQMLRAGAATVRGVAPPPRGLPFEATTRGGDRALSYASWLCPPFCIEPALCPHTRGPRDWSLAGDLESERPGEPFDGRVVFRCLHLVWGVGTIPIAEIRWSRDRLLEGLRRGPRRYLVATSSHCHALAASLDVAPEGPLQSVTS